MRREDSDQIVNPSFILRSNQRSHSKHEKCSDLMSVLASNRFFFYWFGVGIPPFLIGTVVVAFWQSIAFGIVTSAIVLAWVADTFSTTCRRCPFYGTAKCGLPSLIVPYL